MKHRWIALLLVLCLSLGMVGTGSAEESFEDSVDLDLLVAAGIQMYQNVEAHYDTVVNDSGAIGMGIMAWRAVKALELLKRICAADPALSQEKLGSALYQEVLDTGLAVYDANGRWIDYGWHYRLFTADEIAAAKSLISTDVGIAAQNAQARADISVQLKNGWKRGVRGNASLLYYSYAENHYGAGGVKTFMTKVRAALGLDEDALITSLDLFHHGVTLTGYCSEDHYASCNCARSRSYRFIKNVLGWDTGATDLGAHDCPCAMFTDMPDYPSDEHSAIDWAYTHDPQITNGVSKTKFGPAQTVTRAQAMTFLWRAAGKPTPKNAENPFKDVAAGEYYYEAVLWAVEEGITTGTTKTKFSPYDTCSIEQIITFLYRFEGEPDVTGLENPYTDAADGFYSTAPLIWAYHNGIYKSKTAALSGRTDPCRRDQVVTFLWRDMKG